MKLTNPFCISARLLPALVIGGATLQLERLARRSPDNRQVFQWTIDLPNGKTSKGSDLRGGCGGSETLQEMFGALLSFLDAAGESFAYAERRGLSGADAMQGENCDLFPGPVVRWAAQHSDEIGMTRCEIEECAPHSLIDERA